MAQPFGVGDVVGGRYRITHHVVTSADQDIIFQAMDEVLERQVSVLLASRANTKQVATSAKELATGDRASAVQVLDLGLAQDRTYLISSLVDPNQLLDLVVPDSAPYVEPYFTDSLGSELFGQSRQMQPHTYDDDAEYYARLQADLSGGEGSQRFLPSVPGLNRRRPAFLDRVSPEQTEDNTVSSVEDAEPSETTKGAGGGTPLERLKDAGRAHGIDVTAQPAVTHVTAESAESPVPVADTAAAWLRSDFALTDANPSADTLEVLEGSRDLTPAGPSNEAGGALPLTDSGLERDDAQALEADSESGISHEHLPSQAFSALETPSSHDAAHSEPLAQPDTLSRGEEVIDNPPDAPDPVYDSRDTAAPIYPSGSAPLIPPPPDQGISAPEFEQDAASFTSLISAVPPAGRTSFPASAPARPAGGMAKDSQTEFSPPPPGSSKRGTSDSVASAADRSKGLVSQGHLPLTWIIAAVVMVVLVAVIAVVLFSVLGGS